MDSEQRAARALELHLAGATYETIAQQLDYSSKAAAFQAVREALEAQQPPDRLPTELTELARLDAMLVGLWPKARRGDVLAIDRVLRIEERRAELVGPSKPTEGTVLDELTRRRHSRGAAPAAEPDSRRRPG